ncbi:MAG: hypothetical protein AB2L12_07145 [Smithellaceae bacterium]
MDDTTTIYDSLTISAFTDLQKFFKAKDHSPSIEMMQGLYNTINNLTLQLQRQIAPKYYICPLDPGVGKTSAIKAWISAYLRKAREYDNQGVILFFDRHEEIISFLDECNLPEDSYGVLVGDFSTVGKSLNARGVGKDNINNALVLFTTKQQIIIKTHKKASFNAVSTFHYQGKPRMVRIWDESMIVGRAATVNASDIMELVGTVERSGAMELSALLRHYALYLYERKDSELITIPDFDMDLKTAFRWETSKMRNTAETLDMLSGRVAEVKVAGKGRVVLDCIESLPFDLQPCLVTDASARFRGTYSLYEKYHESNVSLVPEDSYKRFNPLKIHILNRSTSKKTYSNLKELENVAIDVSMVIMSRPSEKFLVVVTVSNFRKISRAILEKLPRAQHSLIQFLTWGRHTATNAYIDIPNVIITSLLYYRTADYIASMRASAVFPASNGIMPEEDFRDFQRKEIGHHILQAANRGRMRKCIGKMCPDDSRIWIMGAKGIGLEHIIEEIFPGCEIEEWKTKASSEPRGKRRQMIDHILTELGKGLEHISWSSIRRYFGIKQQSNFKKLYLKDKTFQCLCADSGIVIDNDRFSFCGNPFVNR